MEERKQGPEGLGLRTNDISDGADIATVLYLESVLSNIQSGVPASRQDVKAPDVAAILSSVGGVGQEQTKQLLDTIRRLNEQNIQFQTAGIDIESKLKVAVDKIQTLERQAVNDKTTIQNLRDEAEQNKQKQQENEKKRSAEKEETEKKHLAELEECQKKLKSLERGASRTDTTSKQLTDQVNALQAESAYLNRQLLSAKTDVTNLEAEANKRQTDAEAKRKACETEVKNLKDEAAKMKKEYEAEVKKLQQQLSKAQGSSQGQGQSFSASGSNQGQGQSFNQGTDAKITSDKYDDCAKFMKLIKDMMIELDKRLPPMSNDDMDSLLLRWEKNAEGNLSMEGVAPPSAVYRLVELMADKAKRLAESFGVIRLSTTDLIKNLDALFPDVNKYNGIGLLATEQVILLGNSAANHAQRVSRLKSVIDTHRTVVGKMVDVIKYLVPNQPIVEVSEPIIYLDTASAYLANWGLAVQTALNQFMGIQRRIRGTQLETKDREPLSDELLQLDRVLAWIGSNMTTIQVDRDTAEALVGNLLGIKDSLNGDIRTLFPPGRDGDNAQLIQSLISTFTALRDRYNSLYSASSEMRISVLNVRRSLADQQDVKFENLSEPLSIIKETKTNIELFETEVRALVAWRRLLRDSYVGWAGSMNEFARRRRLHELQEAGGVQGALVGQDYSVTAQTSDEINRNVSAFLQSALQTIEDCAKTKATTKEALAIIGKRATELLKDNDVVYAVDLQKIEEVKEKLGYFFDEMKQVIQTRRSVTDSLTLTAWKMREELAKARAMKIPDDDEGAIKRTFDKLPGKFNDILGWIKEDSEAKDSVLKATVRLTDSVSEASASRNEEMEETKGDGKVKQTLVTRPTNFREIESKIDTIESLLKRNRQLEKDEREIRKTNDKTNKSSFSRIVASYNRMLTQMKLTEYYTYKEFESGVFEAFAEAFNQTCSSFEHNDKERERQILDTKEALAQLHSTVNEIYIANPFPDAKGAVLNLSQLGNIDTFALFVETSLSTMKSYAQMATKYVDSSKKVFDKVRTSVFDLVSEMKVKGLSVPSLYSIDAYLDIAVVIGAIKSAAEQMHKDETRNCKSLRDVLDKLPSRVGVVAKSISKLEEYSQMANVSLELDRVIDTVEDTLAIESEANSASRKVLEALPVPYVQTAETVELKGQESAVTVSKMVKRLGDIIKEEVKKEEKKAEANRKSMTEIYDTVREFPGGLSPSFVNPRGELKLDVIAQQVKEVKDRLELKAEERKTEEKTRMAGLRELYNSFSDFPEAYQRPIADPATFTVDQAKQYIEEVAERITDHVKQDEDDDKERRKELEALYVSFLKLPKDYRSPLADEDKFTVDQANEYVTRLVKSIEEHLKEDEKIYTEARKSVPQVLNPSGLLAFVKIANQCLKDSKKSKGSSSKKDDVDEEDNKGVFGVGVLSLKSARGSVTHRSTNTLIGEEARGHKTSFMDIYSFVSAVSGRVSGTSSDTSMLKLPITAGTGGAQVFIYALQIYVSDRRATPNTIKEQLKILLPRDDESDEDGDANDKIRRNFDRAAAEVEEEEANSLQPRVEEKREDGPSLLGTKRKLKDSNREDKRLSSEISETAKQVIATVRYIQRIDEMIEKGRFSAAFASVVSSAVYAPMDELRVLLTQYYCRKPDKDPVTLEELVSTEVLRQPISALCAEIMNAVKASNAASFVSSDAHQRIVNQAQSSKNEFFRLYVRQAPYEWSMKTEKAKGTKSLVLKF